MKPTELLDLLEGAKQLGIDIGTLGHAGAGDGSSANSMAPSTPAEQRAYETLSYLSRTDDASVLFPLIKFREGLDAWATDSGLVDRIKTASQDRTSAASEALYASRDYQFYQGAAYALVAKDAYYDTDIPGLLPQGVTRYSWEQAEGDFGLRHSSMENAKTGYFAALYRDANNDRVVYANRGSDDWSDASVDGLQAFGFKEQQYKQAYQNALQISKIDSNVVFVGHSLGGGLASLQALATNKQAWTYNSASLSDGTLNRYNVNLNNAQRLIHAYYVQGDVLSAIQDIPSLPKTVAWLDPTNIIRDLPSAAGTRIPLQAPYLPVLPAQVPLWPAEMHSLHNLIGSFAQMLPKH